MPKSSPNSFHDPWSKEGRIWHLCSGNDVPGKDALGNDDFCTIEHHHFKKTFLKPPLNTYSTFFSFKDTKKNTKYWLTWIRLSTLFLIGSVLILEVQELCSLQLPHLEHLGRGLLCQKAHLIAFMIHGVRMAGSGISVLAMMFLPKMLLVMMTSATKEHHHFIKPVLKPPFNTYSAFLSFKDKKKNTKYWLTWIRLSTLFLIGSALILEVQELRSLQLPHLEHLGRGLLCQKAHLIAFMINGVRRAGSGISVLAMMFLPKILSVMMTSATKEHHPFNTHSAFLSFKDTKKNTKYWLTWIRLSTLFLIGSALILEVQELRSLQLLHLEHLGHRLLIQKAHLIAFMIHGVRRASAKSPPNLTPDGLISPVPRIRVTSCSGWSWRSGRAWGESELNHLPKSVFSLSDHGDQAFRRSFFKRNHSSNSYFVKIQELLLFPLLFSWNGYFSRSFSSSFSPTTLSVLYLSPSTFFCGGLCRMIQINGVKLCLYIYI